ncbi:OmpP1/FadL family transporter [Rhizobium sp. FKY42]|uniref:OmpP1/FadL family transporter n=1 Tax=Rhizobium sp. FKY42 TaxID=2562310 RepID=UPI0010BFF78B|nr:OmpP1/FadL family transporter [Rhizobium sp. FKY42]
MVRTHLTKGLLAAAAVGALNTSALAGGLERGGYNIDLLFDRSSVAVESSTTYVAPQRKLKNVQDIDRTDGLGSNGLNGGTTTADDSEGYWVPRVGIKAAIGDAADCMFDYSQPWGAHTKPGRNWRGANENTETKIKSDNYAVTCSYRFDVGPGQLRVIGGGFHQEVSGFKERLVAPAGFTGVVGNGIGRLDLKDSAWGWRAGVAYEIPEYAFRASLVYNSEVNLDDISGTLNLSQVNGRVLNVYGAQKMPDSLELKVQSGIAPDWLAFGSVKWVDWSQLQTIPLCVVGTPVCNGATQVTSLDLGYRDGWTISGGIGHKFNDQWSGAVSLTWDRGTSQGFGTQTDTWSVGAAVSYSPTQNVELRLAGLLGILTSGTSSSTTINGVRYGTDATYSFGNDLVAAVSTSVKVKF